MPMSRITDCATDKQSEWDTVHRNLPDKIGDILTPEQYKAVEELGILVDKDDQVP